MISITTTVRATAIALVIATVAAPVAGAASAGRITAHKDGFSAQVGATISAPAAPAHGHLSSAHHMDTAGEFGTPLIGPTINTEHGVSLTDPLLVPTLSTERVAGLPATVIIRSAAPATGFDWAAAMVGALAAVAAVLLAYGAATVLRSRSGELVNN